MGITWRLDGITKWGVSWNRGNPKSSILMGTFSINHPFWGTFILGNPQIFDQETFAKMLSHRVRPDGHLGIRGGGEMWTRQPWTKPQHATNIDSIWQCNIVNVLYIYILYIYDVIIYRYMRFYWTCVYIRIHYNDACNKCVSCHVICGLQYQCGHVHVYVDVYILYIIYIYVCECRCEHIIVSVNCTGSILCGILMQIGLREKPSPRAKFTCGMSHSGEPTRCFSASACLESWSKVRLYPYCEMVINPYIRIYITFVRIAINTVYIIYI